MSDEKKIISREDAFAQGLRFFFTGKPCKRGHVAERYVTDRGCKECVASRMKAYWQDNLEKCKEYQKKYSAENAEKIKQRSAEWYANNKERARERDKRNYAMNGEKIRQRTKNYYRNNVEVISEYHSQYRIKNAEKVRLRREKWLEANIEMLRQRAKKWREKNKERLKEQKAKYTAENPEIFLTNARNRRARRQGAEGNHTREDVKNLLRTHRNKCATCFAPIARKPNQVQRKLHLDHITPLVRGGDNLISNIQPLCSGCNLSKGARTMGEWLGPNYAEDIANKVHFYLKCEAVTLDDQ
jgi:phage-related minor tail protein